MTLFSALHRRRTGKASPWNALSTLIQDHSTSSKTENTTLIYERDDVDDYLKDDDKNEKQKNESYVISTAKVMIWFQRLFRRFQLHSYFYHQRFKSQSSFPCECSFSGFFVLMIVLFVVFWKSYNTIVVDHRVRYIPFRMSQGDISSSYILRYSNGVLKSVNDFVPFPYAQWGNEFKSPKPDYGSLKLTFFQIMMESSSLNSYTRKRRYEYDRWHGHVWQMDEYEFDWEVFDQYYAFDDDYVRNKPFEEMKRNCRRTAFHRMYHPNCNTFHEIPMQMSIFLGEGGYREAYLLQERYDPELVVKVNRFHHNPFEYDRYEFIRMDALVMERLTASPRIVDIYGHCATSVNTEFLPNELDSLIIPGVGDGKHVNDTLDVDPQNNFTITQKLDYALQMAESIADLHGFKDGVIIHDDIQTVQYLFTSDGRLKLNDFNRAEAMLFDEEVGEYCKYRNGAGGGDYRAPEEYVDGRLNEKIDVFSFGNNIYALITGLWNFYELGDKIQRKIDKIKAGELPYIDRRYRERNYVQDRLIHVMEKCWKFDPDERADIFWVVKYLRETKDIAIQMGFYDDQYVNLHFQDWPVELSETIANLPTFH